MMIKLKQKSLPMVLAAALCLPSVQAAEPSYEVFGTYNLGCMTNSVSFPKDSPDYQLQVWGPGRHYAHPSMIAYLNDLIKRAKASGLPALLIGDLSKKHGGPYGEGSSHASHAIGLDVDLPFDFAAPRKSDYELSHPQDRPIVTNKGPNSNFDEQITSYIILAASDPKVERIFVNPRIKEHLCKVLEGEDRQILHTLRPWFGHRAHMHVRLKCPDDSPYCVRQKAAPPGDGCLENQSWFMPPDPSAQVKPQKKVKPKLPAQCQSILALDD